MNISSFQVGTLSGLAGAAIVSTLLLLALVLLFVVGVVVCLVIKLNSSSLMINDLQQH